MFKKQMSSLTAVKPVMVWGKQRNHAEYDIWKVSIIYIGKVHVENDLWKVSILHINIQIFHHFGKDDSYILLISFDR